MTFDYICYTDGACKGNPGPGGWGVLLRKGTEPATELFGGALLVTNNQMELTAAIEALKQVPEGSTVELFADSEYVIKGITQWVAGWKAKGWKTAAKQPVKNQELWEQLERLNARRSVTWRWVKGHANDPGNERADYLANKGVPGMALPAVSAGQPQGMESLEAPSLRPAGPSEWFILNVALYEIAKWDAFQSRRFGIQPDFIISILNRSPADLDPPPVLSPALQGCPVQTFYFNDMDEPGPCAPQEFHAQQLCALLRFCQETGKNVLVHCTAGANRSGSIARHAVTYYGARMAGTSVPTTGCALLTQLLEAAQAKLR